MNDNKDVGRDPRSRRIVGIGHEHDACGGCDGGAHRRQIVRVVARRHLDAGGASRMHGQRIDGERVARVDGMVTGPQERLRHELEHVVGAVAEHDTVGRHAVLRGECRLEREAVAVRIAAKIVGGLRDRAPHGGARSARIFVGRKLDDVPLRETEFAGELTDGLARRVRREIAHVRRRLQRRVAGSFLFLGCAHRIPNKELQDRIPIS